MARNIFKGLGVALITPFTSDGSVDFKSLTCLVEHLIDNGADFLCILATTSEAPCLSAYEKEEVKKHVIDINRGRLPILMGFIENVLRLPLVPTRITTLQKMTEILKTLKI